tara:strand:+ start:14653 stop:15033 length:381 start_codon:yes stop_codon:yes gene_type:complete
MKRPDALDLLGRWETFARSLHGSYDFGLDDYLNDVDVRQLIETMVEEEPSPAGEEFGARLAAADAIVRAATVSTAHCIWGATNAEEQRWTRDHNWWYFAAPRQCGAEMEADLARQVSAQDCDASDS